MTEHNGLGELLANRDELKATAVSSAAKPVFSVEQLVALDKTAYALDSCIE